MTKSLIVLAHPGAKSFAKAWAQKTAEISQELGQEVIWSDLGEMGFDPIEKSTHYSGHDNEHSKQDQFDVLKAQESASETGNLPRDVAIEIDKIKQADRIIFHFPIWWFSPPAVLKGWLDRVLAHGALHSVDQRFDNGMCRGKKALFCVTTGSKAEESAHNGKEGDVEMLLWPMAYTLRYLGLTVLKPKVIHGVHSYHEGAEEQALRERLGAELDSHAQTIADFDARAEIPFNRDNEFSEEGTLLPYAPSYSHFIRHEK